MEEKGDRRSPKVLAEKKKKLGNLHYNKIVLHHVMIWNKDVQINVDAKLSFWMDGSESLMSLSPKYVLSIVSCNIHGVGN